MQNSPIKTEALIVGAGPTGLSLACQFVRHGVDFLIIEKEAGVTPYSKAIGVHARTLEIYEQIGLAQKVLEQGAIAAKARFIEGGEVRAELDLSNLGEGLSPYPFVLLFEQSKNERLLYDYLKRAGKDVLWRTELESFSQTNEKVTAQVRTADGAVQTIEAEYLIGCDGAKSLTRHALGLQFEGDTAAHLYYVADAQVDWKLSHDSVYLFLLQDTLLALFPLKGENRFRIVGTFPDEFAKDEGEVLYEEIERRIKQVAEMPLDVHDVAWVSTYKVHSRHVSAFSSGRCFLAGDSAHIHSLAGAQGMNTGIQDGYNLAWKMALVMKGEANAKLLESYNEERLANAKRLVRTTDRMFQFATSSEWFLKFIRKDILPSVANYILGLDAVNKFVFPTISQIGVNYQRASLSDHAGDENFRVKAGDRMPYFLIEGESVYDKLRQPKFYLLVFSDAEDSVQNLRTEIENQSAELIDFNALSLNKQAREIFGAHDSFIALLRPDNYIGFISNELSSRNLRNYLREFIGRL